MNSEKERRPIVGITMGDPAGVGPEIILEALNRQEVFGQCRPIVFGDAGLLRFLSGSRGVGEVRVIGHPREGEFQKGWMDVMNLSDLKPEEHAWGAPTEATSRAMIRYIETAVDAALAGEIDAIVTAPINKKAMKLSGCPYDGHTELLRARTGTTDVVMMMAGERLRVALVTIHTALARVPAMLTTEGIVKTVSITAEALSRRFGIQHPRLALAGLNPHAGEEGLFGDEERRVIAPAADMARAAGLDVSAPLPPDTVFVRAVEGAYDAVVCMYHDQGLIPFKLLHFRDGVNTTLGLPIIRTSVDHGTAYDIAGKGRAGVDSLLAAIRMAASQAARE